MQFGPGSCANAPPGSRDRIFRRWRMRLTLGLVVIYATYLAVGNLLLNTQAGRELANRKPDKFVASWDTAWTLYPGQVQATNLRLAGHVVAPLETRRDLSGVHLSVNQRPAVRQPCDERNEPMAPCRSASHPAGRRTSTWSKRLSSSSSLRPTWTEWNSS